MAINSKKNIEIKSSQPIFEAFSKTVKKTILKDVYLRGVSFIRDGQLISRIYLYDLLKAIECFADFGTKIDVQCISWHSI